MAMRIQQWWTWTLHHLSFADLSFLHPCLWSNHLVVRQHLHHLWLDWLGVYLFAHLASLQGLNMCPHIGAISTVSLLLHQQLTNTLSRSNSGLNLPSSPSTLRWRNNQVFQELTDREYLHQQASPTHESPPHKVQVPVWPYTTPTEIVGPGSGAQFGHLNTVVPPLSTSPVCPIDVHQSTPSPVATPTFKRLFRTPGPLQSWDLLDSTTIGRHHEEDHSGGDVDLPLPAHLLIKISSQPNAIGLEAISFPSVTFQTEVVGARLLGGEADGSDLEEPFADLNADVGTSRWANYSSASNSEIHRHHALSQEPASRPPSSSWERMIQSPPLHQQSQIHQRDPSPARQCRGPKRFNAKNAARRGSATSHDAPTMTPFSTSFNLRTQV
ncbi:unnamed protein product [Calypogeia fissa]